jgi:16S rRNA (cytosine1402-N4)-methyltransferase
VSAALKHEPVLLTEVLEALAIQSDGCYLDATFGRGGHSGAVLARLGERGRVIALDRDPTAIAAGRELFAADKRMTVVHRPFAQLKEALDDLAQDDLGRSDVGVDDAGVVGVTNIFDGALFDLGVSSPQLDDAARGFSFMNDGPLDMRMDTSTGITAAVWLAKVSERDLQHVISEYGEERFARRIAAAIVAARRAQVIDATAQLARIVSEAVPTREPGKHPATRTFQAIRIAVNDELGQIDHALQQVIDTLKPGGRLCVISFHSLEDQRVKKFMQKHSQDDPMYAGLPEVPVHMRAKLRRVGGAIHPSAAEVSRNPRSRSSILRVAERVAA